MGIKRHKPEEIVSKLRQVRCLWGKECRAYRPPAPETIIAMDQSVGADQG